MRLIGINGFKESGKDTAFSFIQSIESNPPHDHNNVQRVGFADKLKIMAARALGIKVSDAESIKLMNVAKEHWVFTVEADVLQSGPIRPTVTTFNGREYLQWFGGEARDVFGENFWIDQVLPPFPNPGNRSLHRQNLEARYPGVNTLVITDVRYPNEAERVKELGGEVWEIVRPGLESDGHASEQPLPRELVDIVIFNDGTLDTYKELVDGALHG